MQRQAASDALVAAPLSKNVEGLLEPPPASLRPSPPRLWLRMALVAYVGLLTWALLTPDPLAWLRTRPIGPKAPLPWYLAWLLYDKTEHFAAYGLLAALLIAATRWPPAVIFAAAAAHGGITEILQHWSPPRDMEFRDWVADLVGAGAVLLAYRLFPRRRSD